MGARGPAPKPTQLKVLEGNPGKRKLNNNEPKPTAKAPKCPKHLDPVAKKEWKRIVPELERLGLLTLVDGAALEIYCTAYSRWLAAEQIVREHYETTKRFVVMTENGYPMNHPEIGIANQAAKIVKQFIAEFGLSPAARSRINLPPPPKENPLRKFLENRGNSS